MVDIKTSKSGAVTVKLTRGDSAYLHVNIFDGEKPYEFLEDDVIKIQVRKQEPNGELAFEGKVEPNPNGGYDWHIYPYDTAELPITNVEYDEDENIIEDTIVRYYWDAELVNGNGDIFTFIPCSPFVIMQEVTLEV